MKALKPVNREKTRYVLLELIGLKKITSKEISLINKFLEEKFGYFDYAKSFLSVKDSSSKKNSSFIIYQINRKYLDLFTSSIVLLQKIGNIKVQPVVKLVSGSIKKVKDD
jgi:RNase P/RNase MRP subunit POP5